MKTAYDNKGFVTTTDDVMVWAWIYRVSDGSLAMCSEKSDQEGSRKILVPQSLVKRWIDASLAQCDAQKDLEQFWNRSMMEVADVHP